MRPLDFLYAAYLGLILGLALSLWASGLYRLTSIIVARRAAAWP
jgi:hypothetical protein